MYANEHAARETEVRLDAVAKIYGQGGNQVAALKELTLSFGAGTFTAVMGPSGSGKSTFLHCAAGLVKPTSGSVQVGGTDLAHMDEVQLTKLRCDRIGFISRAFNLLPALTVMQNLLLPLELAGRRPDKELIRSVVDRVGLSDRTRHLPGELSGGSSNAWRSPAPWCPSPTWPSPTNRRARSTRAPPTPSPRA